jgi:hypothetical protein
MEKIDGNAVGIKPGYGIQRFCGYVRITESAIGINAARLTMKMPSSPG